MNSLIKVCCIPAAKRLIQVKSLGTCGLRQQVFVMTAQVYAGNGADGAMSGDVASQAMRRHPYPHPALNDWQK